MSTGKAKRGPCLLAVALVLALFLLGAVAGCHEARLACQHDGGCRDAERMGCATRSAVLSSFFFFSLSSFDVLCVAVRRCEKARARLDRMSRAQGRRSRAGL